MKKTPARSLFCELSRHASYPLRLSCLLGLFPVPKVVWRSNASLGHLSRGGYHRQFVDFGMFSCVWASSLSDTNRNSLAPGCGGAKEMTTPWCVCEPSLLTLTQKSAVVTQVEVHTHAYNQPVNATLLQPPASPPLPSRPRPSPSPPTTERGREGVLDFFFFEKPTH